ncbi:MAG: CD225/dispanin family protein [Marinifilaceae bacterium]|nr:CD225/dispanin family protein [Marinifilaceae bacterium]
MEENQYTRNYVGDGAPQFNQYQQNQQQFHQGPMQMQKPPRPDTYLLWAILTTCFCCLPFGVYAIIKSSKVESLYAMGDYEGAYKASHDAKKWSIISAVAAGIVSVLYFMIILLAGLFGANEYGYVSI